MKWVVVAVAVGFVALASLDLFLASAARTAQAQRHFTAEEIARGRSFAFQRKLVAWSATGVALAALAVLALTGLGPKLAAACDRLSGGRWLLTVLLFGGCCAAVLELLGFPFRLGGGFFLLRAWGLTDRSLLSWLRDYVVGGAVSAVLGAVLLVGLYSLLRFFPRGWWALAWAGGVLLAVLLMFIAPVVIAPLFNRFTPLRETRHAALALRIEALVRAAGLPVGDVLAVDASRQSQQTNAYFTGFGATRRIVLYDTLLERHTPDEVLGVVAHEAAHWREQHIVKGLAVAAAGALLGLFLLSRFLVWAVASGRFGIRAPSDPAALPLILLAISLAAGLTAPFQNALSRHFEREADRISLELGTAPGVFIDTEKRLARDNILDVAPSDVSVWLFASHPPIVERIERAERREGP